MQVVVIYGADQPTGLEVAAVLRKAKIRARFVGIAFFNPRELEAADAIAVLPSAGDDVGEDIKEAYAARHVPTVFPKGGEPDQIAARIKTEVDKLAAAREIDAPAAPPDLEPTDPNAKATSHADPSQIRKTGRGARAASRQPKPIAPVPEPSAEGGEPDPNAPAKGRSSDFL